MKTALCKPSMKQAYMHLQLRPLLQTDSQTQLPWSALSPPKNSYKTTFKHRGVTMRVNDVRGYFILSK